MPLAKPAHERRAMTMAFRLIRRYGSWDNIPKKFRNLFSVQTVTLQTLAGPRQRMRIAAEPQAAARFQRVEGKNARQAWTRKGVVETIRSAHASGIDLSNPGIQGMYQALFKAGIKFFDSWDAAVEAAGLDPKEYQLRQSWTRKKLLDTIAQMRAKGEPLNYQYVDAHHTDARNAAQILFGGWGKALQAAGINSKVASPYNFYTDEEIFKRIIDLYASGCASSFDAKRVNPNFHAVASRRFGGWGNAVARAGFIYARIRKDSRRQHMSHYDRQSWIDLGASPQVVDYLYHTGIEPRYAIGLREPLPTLLEKHKVIISSLSASPAHHPESFLYVRLPRIRQIINQSPQPGLDYARCGLEYLRSLYKDNGIPETESIFRKIERQLNQLRLPAQRQLSRVNQTGQ